MNLGANNFAPVVSLWSSLVDQVAASTSEAFKLGERPVGYEAAEAMRKWVEALEAMQGERSNIGLEAMGMSNGGAALVLFNRKSCRQFTLRFTASGEFFMASGVLKNLKSTTFTPEEAVPSVAIHWLNG